jgi:hypothetical protein
MLKKIYFPFVLAIELALIFFLSGPVLEKTIKSHTFLFSRLQILFVAVLVISVGTINEKYKKATAMILLMLYIIYIIVVGNFLNVHWRQMIIDQNSF